VASADRRLLEYGERAVLVECAGLDDALGLMVSLGQQPLEAVEEIVPGARTLLLRIRRPLTRGERSALLQLEPAVRNAQDLEELEIAVRYDGEDLDEVARLTGLSRKKVVEAHTGQPWTVGFCGFAPGFAYLSGENERLRVPRRSTPRTRVPAGSVGLADHWSGVYPRRGPGGWQLIGRTDAAIWNLDREPPALLRPGVVVRFTQV
jgi:KipI family sensor histidine kinase inhibitor